MAPFTLLKKLSIVCLLLLTCGLALAQQLPPKSNTLVTDSTNTLTPDEKSRLESKLVAFDDSTSTQIAVVILKSVGNYDINQYGAALIRAWGIGQKGKNNGILILVAIADRKVSIQTGYGAEGAVPDIVTHDIIVNDITPNFKQGKYYDGLDLATTSLMQHMHGEYKAENKPQAQANQPNDDSGGAGTIAILIIIVVVILILIFRGRGGGGGRRGGSNPFWWFLAGSFLGSSNNGGGGFSDGGGSDSGGGGDFGGFGGGDSGGGGSSGSW